MRKVIIVGASGFGAEVLWVISRINAVQPQFDVIGFCDDAEDKQSGIYSGLPLLGSVDLVCREYRDVFFFCAIGDNKARKRVFEKFSGSSITPISIVDPTAVVADDAVVKTGAYIGIGSIVSVGSVICGGCIVNHNVTVGHDVIVHNFAQLCPGVSVSGGVVIGEGALFGSNSCVMPGKRVGDWVVVGIGTVVVSDLGDGVVRMRIK